VGKAGPSFWDQGTSVATAHLRFGRQFFRPHRSRDSDDVRPSFLQRECHGTADAARGAGDEGDAIGRQSRSLKTPQDIGVFGGALSRSVRLLGIHR
jgi:hypothetical protein